MQANQLAPESCNPSRDPFENLVQEHQPQTISFTAPSTSTFEKSPAERLFRLLRNGSFALGKAEIEALFAMSVQSLEPTENQSSLTRLCMEISMISHRAGDPLKVISVWFDASTQMLNLRTAKGQCDRLSLRYLTALPSSL